MAHVSRFTSIDRGEVPSYRCGAPRGLRSPCLDTGTVSFLLPPLAVPCSPLTASSIRGAISLAIPAMWSLFFLSLFPPCASRRSFSTPVQSSSRLAVAVGTLSLHPSPDRRTTHGAFLLSLARRRGPLGDLALHGSGDLVMLAPNDSLSSHVRRRSPLQGDLGAHVSGDVVKLAPNLRYLSPLPGSAPLAPWRPRRACLSAVSGDLVPNDARHFLPPSSGTTTPLTTSASASPMILLCLPGTRHTLTLSAAVRCRELHSSVAFLCVVYPCLARSMRFSLVSPTFGGADLKSVREI
ncbi:hypothetical protein DFH06DRAFT_1331798 [Mycena polygramma]|nr:hypothetical protein DFH06DRAFT_1331798 [Mycena polygramma]